jgi:cytochrome oxidase Cu insertion factor (SCO1/SenC/PrrC family)
MNMSAVSRRCRWVAITFIASGLIVSSGAPLFAAADASAPAVTTFAQINRLPNFPLVDQFGHQTSLAALMGKPVLVSFIHTDCQGPCELMTARMKSVADDLEPSFASKVTMVSVTTDPKEDHPSQLAAYAKAQGAEGPGWVFLTGNPTDVAHVLQLYGVAQGGADDAMTHVFDLHLIGSDGREVHQYHGPEIKAATVAADIKTALARR